jgi:hypothetical protein
MIPEGVGRVLSAMLFMCAVALFIVLATITGVIVL